MGNKLQKMVISIGFHFERLINKFHQIYSKTNWQRNKKRITIFFAEDRASEEEDWNNIKVTCSILLNERFGENWLFGGKTHWMNGTRELKLKMEFQPIPNFAARKRRFAQFIEEEIFHIDINRSRTETSCWKSTIYNSQMMRSFEYQVRMQVKILILIPDYKT